MRIKRTGFRRIVLCVINLTVTLGVWSGGRRRSVPSPSITITIMPTYTYYVYYITLHRPLFTTQTRKRRQIGNDEWIRTKLYYHCCE